MSTLLLTSQFIASMASGPVDTSAKNSVAPGAISCTISAAAVPDFSEDGELLNRRDPHVKVGVLHQVPEKPH